MHCMFIEELLQCSQNILQIQHNAKHCTVTWHTAHAIKLIKLKVISVRSPAKFPFIFAIIRGKRGSWHTNKIQIYRLLPGSNMCLFLEADMRKDRWKRKRSFRTMSGRASGLGNNSISPFVVFSGIMLWWSGDTVHIEDIVIHNYVVKRDDKCIVFNVLKHDKEYTKLLVVCSDISPNVTVHFNVTNAVHQLLMFMIEKSFLLYWFQTHSFTQPHPAGGSPLYTTHTASLGEPRQECV